MQDSSACQYPNLAVSPNMRPAESEATVPAPQSEGCRGQGFGGSGVQALGAPRGYLAYIYCIVSMLQALTHIQIRLNDCANDMFRSLEACTSILDSVYTVIHTYTVLANKADAGGCLLWIHTHTLHWLWHWSRTRVLLNPRRSNCMLDGDYVGAIRTCVDVPVPGTPMERSR